MRGSTCKKPPRRIAIQLCSDIIEESTQYPFSYQHWQCSRCAQFGKGQFKDVSGDILNCDFIRSRYAMRDE